MKSVIGILCTTTVVVLVGSTAVLTPTSGQSIQDPVFQPGGRCGTKGLTVLQKCQCFHGTQTFSKGGTKEQGVVAKAPKVLQKENLLDDCVRRLQSGG
jgi:hypothetical protein